jgi:hypothetical protein
MHKTDWILLFLFTYSCNGFYFDITVFFCSREFTVCYRTFDDYGQETYLSLLTDWDLDAAFLR